MTPLQAICSEHLLRKPPPSIPSPAPGPLYLVGCAVKDASSSLSRCRAASDTIEADACARAARRAADVAAGHAATVRAQSPGTDESREARELATEAADYAVLAEEHVEALRVMARAKRTVRRAVTP